MNYSKLSTIGILLILSISLFSQEGDKKYLTTLGKIDLGFSGLGLSFETPTSNKVLLEIAAGAGAGYKINEDFKYRLYFDNPAIFASVHMKYYFNQQDRIDKGRPISYNAGNFFGI